MPDTYLKTLSTGENTYKVMTPDDLPETFPPSEHNHDDRYNTKLEMTGILAGKADVDHNHDDRYYTETETNALLNNKSDLDHIHDDRYYTESETNILLAGKANVVHAHGDITGDGKITANAVDISNGDRLTVVDASDGNKIKRTNISFDGSTATQALSKKGTFESFAPASHDHDDRYYTEDEMDDLLAEKVDEAPLNHKTYGRKDGEWHELDTSLVEWGEIGGTLADQTDLQNALDEKANVDDLGTMAAEDDAPSDDKQYVRKNGDWSEIEELEWGNIVGDLEDQTDLKTALDDKLDAETVELTGDIVTFEAETDHAIQNVTVAIEPVQDLHGQSNPYPAGGGKNKYSDIYSDYTKFVDYYVCPIALTEGKWALSAFLVGAQLTGCAVGIVQSGTRYSDFVGQRNVLNSSGQSSNQSLTVNSDWTDPHLVVYCTGETQFNQIFANYHIQLEKSETVTTYAPYSNICSISGWTEANVQRTGVNLFDKTTTNVVNGYFGSAQPANIIGGSNFRIVYIDCKPNTTYTIQKISSKIFSLGWAKDVPSSGSLIYNSVGHTTATSATYTTGADAKYLCAYIYNANTDTVTYQQILDSIQIELGSTPTEYVPYSGTTATIDLNGIRYGGELDVTRGVMKVTKAIKDLGNLTWTVETAFNGTFKSYVSGSDYGVTGDVICSCFKTVLSGAEISNNDACIYAKNNGVSLYVSWRQYTDAITFKSAVTGQTLVYPLAQPFEVILTPAQISSIIGTNHIWSDTGQTTVELRKTTGDLAYQDTVDYETQVINKPDLSLKADADIITYTEAVMKATRNYTIGDLICIAGGDLYRATANISNNANLTVGTNIITTTIDAELKLRAKSADVDAALALKADIDGSYPDLTVGNAEQLVSTVGIEESTSYTFRTTGGSIDVGDRLMLKEVTGGTVAWNQLISFSNSGISKTENGVTFTSNYDGSYSVYTDANGATANTYLSIPDTPKAKIGHKYLYTGTPSTGSYQTYYSYMTGNSLSYGIDTGKGMLYNGVGDGQIYTVAAYIKSGTVITAPVKFIPQCFDLTQMFGSTIADYIYSLEQANAGAGVAWFRKLFSKDYYPYNAGELLSVNTSAHKMVGFNLLKTFYGWTSNINLVSFNTDYAFRVIREAKYEYCFEGVKNATSWRTGLICFDLNRNKILGEVLGTILGMYYNVAGYYVNSSNGTLKSANFTSNFDGYVIPILCLGDTTSSSIVVNPCAHLVWDGERDGEYEPYEEHSYSLDSTLTLRGIPKLDASNNLYYDGDTYEPDGTVTIKYGIVDLGTQNWSSWVGDSGGNTFATYLSERKLSGFNALCLTYSTLPSDNRIWATILDYDKILFLPSETYSILIRDTSYTNASTFKASLSGVYLVYELAEPITESADPYQETQICDDFGTEEFIVTEQNDVVIPVGNTAIYQPNLRAKLEMAPESPDGNGDYIVRQISGINEYIPISNVVYLKSSTYSKTEVDTALDLKADKSDTYTKAETEYVAAQSNEAIVKYIENVSIAYFDDGADNIPVKDLKIAIEPIQDLHGYDNPWPAGGGKNFADFDKTFPIANSNVIITDFVADKTFNAVTITLFCTNVVYTTAGNTVIKLRTSGNVDTDINVAEFGMSSNTTLNGVYSVTKTNISFQKALWIYYSNFTSGSMKIQIEQGSAATSYAPYENICPISGWDTANVTRTGVNLVGDSDIVTSYYIYARATTSTRVLGQALASAQWSCTDYVKVLPNTQYIYNVPMWINASAAGLVFYKTKDISSAISGVTTNVQGTYQYTFTTPSDCHYIRFSWYSGEVGTGVSVNPNYPQVQLEKGSTATPYQSYQGTIATIDLNGTRYGGELDITSGKMRVTMGYADLGTLSWSYDSTYTRFYTPTLPNAKTPPNNWTKAENLICSSYKTVDSNSTASTSYNGSIGMSTTGRIDIRNTAYTDGTSFKTAVTGQTVVYELAELFEVQLTPTQITTLLNENHIWADTGDILNLDYVTDTESYIQKNAITAKAPVITESASGSIVSIDDGAEDMPLESLIVNVEPVQDLHGYDEPWPAGGGINLFDPDNFGQVTVDGISVYGHSYVDTGSYAIKAYGSSPGGNQYLYARVKNSDNTWESVKYIVAYNSQTPQIIEITSGQTLFVYDAVPTDSIATVKSYFNAWKLQVVKSSTQPDKYYTYSNICPISGWNTVNVSRTGVNLLVIDNEPESTSQVSVTKNADGSYTFTATGTISPSYNKGILGSTSTIRNRIKLKAGKTYLINGVNVQINGVTKATQNSILLYTANEGDFINACWFYFNSTQLPQGSSVTLKPMIQEGATSIDYYIPWTNNIQIAIPLGQTVYGGTLDVKAGKMTVTHLHFVPKSNEIVTGPIHTANNGWAFTLHYYPALSLKKGACLSSINASKHYGLISQVGFCDIANDNGNPIFFLPDSISGLNSSSTVTEIQNAFWTYIANTSNLEAVYELFTPTVITGLTSAQMSTLLGTNNIWADTGDVSLEYRADTKLFIEKVVAEATRNTRKMIAGEEVEMKATKNYTVGEYLWVGDDLYKVTANIANGGTITVNSNVSKCTVGEQLKLALS